MEETKATTAQVLQHLESRSDDRPSADLSTALQASIAVAAALDKKAYDLKVLDLSQVSDFTDCFLICSGNNERQVQAIASSIQDELRDHKVKPLHVEGYNHGRWVLLDYGGDMVIHVFHDQSRMFYELERLWSDAPDITVKHLPDDAPAELVAQATAAAAVTSLAD